MLNVARHQVESSHRRSTYRKSSARAHDSTRANIRARNVAKRPNDVVFQQSIIFNTLRCSEREREFRQHRNASPSRVGRRYIDISAPRDIDNRVVNESRTFRDRVEDAPGKHSRSIRSYPSYMYTCCNKPIDVARSAICTDDRLHGESIINKLASFARARVGTRVFSLVERTRVPSFICYLMLEQPLVNIFKNAFLLTLAASGYANGRWCHSRFFWLSVAPLRE